MAGRHSADRRTRNSGARPARGSATNPLPASRKGDKRRCRHVRPGFFSDRRRAPSARIMAAKPSRHFRLIPRTSRQPRVVQVVRVSNALRGRKSRTTGDFGRLDGETRTRTGDATIFSRAALLLRLADLQGFSSLSGGVAVSALCRTCGRLLCEKAHGDVRGPFFAEPLPGRAKPPAQPPGLSLPRNRQSCRQEPRARSTDRPVRTERFHQSRAPSAGACSRRVVDRTSALITPS